MLLHFAFKQRSFFQITVQFANFQLTQLFCLGTVGKVFDLTDRTNQEQETKMSAKNVFL
jgi:signal transduction histidine kinase